MTDQVTICNLALDAMGSRSEISSLDEDSQSARTLSLHYQPALEAVLQAAQWNFARKQATLSLLKAGAGTTENATGTGPPPPTPWLYEYALPSDCVQARYVMPSFSASPDSTPAASLTSGPAVRFLISSDADSNGNAVNVLLTNQPNALLVYTYRVSNPELFDGQFVVAFSSYLGARISTRLSGDKALAKMAFEIADRATKEARASNGNEGLTIIDSIPDWMRVRGYASDWAYPPGSMFWQGPQNLTFIQ